MPSRRRLHRHPPNGRAAALGYASLASDGPDLATQRRGIEAACADLELELVSFVWDRERQGERLGLAGALDRIGAGDASCLVVNDLERLSRDVEELATVLDRLERDDARLIVLDVGLDSDTPAGRLALARPEPEEMEEEAAEPEALEEPEELAEPEAPEELVEPEPEPEPVVEAPPKPPPTATAVRALGYASAAADDPGVGRDLAAQKAAIERHGAEHGIELVEVIREREAGGRALDRAGLSYLIERLAAGQASCVVVDRLDRLSHSVAELGAIVQWLDRNGVRLIALEDHLDTASPAGRQTVRTLASVAGWERRRIAERTRKGLAAARAARHASAGRDGTDWEAVRRRIASMRADGMTLQSIADVLNREGVPTQRGGTEWRPSSVQTAAGYKRRPRTRTVDDLPDISAPSERPRANGGAVRKRSDT
jgi:DNA invertase Pin-like site-specific DNA recombinase